MTVGEVGPVEAVLFDKDGTLFDFQATWGAWAEAVIRELAGADADVAEALGEAMGFDRPAGRFRPDSIVVAGTALKVAEAIRPHLRPARSVRDVTAVLGARARGISPVPAVPLLPFLRALAGGGLHLAVVTNDSEAAARAHLAATRIEAGFDAIIGADSGHGAKPGPGPVLAALGRMGVRPGRAVMVGDSRHDLVSGRAAGTRTLGVLTGTAGRSDLAPLADAVPDDVGAIPAWLDRQARRWQPVDGQGPRRPHRPAIRPDFTGTGFAPRIGSYPLRTPRALGHLVGAGAHWSVGRSAIAPQSHNVRPRA